MKKKRNKYSQEDIERFEKNTGCKIVNMKKFILKYQGRLWRPILTSEEVLLAFCSNQLMLSLNGFLFVNVKWRV